MLHFLAMKKSRVKLIGLATVVKIGKTDTYSVDGGGLHQATILSMLYSFFYLAFLFSIYHEYQLLQVPHLHGSESEA